MKETISFFFAVFNMMCLSFWCGWFLRWMTLSDAKEEVQETRPIEPITKAELMDIIDDLAPHFQKEKTNGTK